MQCDRELGIICTPRLLAVAVVSERVVPSTSQAGLWCIELTTLGTVSITWSRYHSHSAACYCSLTPLSLLPACLPPPPPFHCCAHLREGKVSQAAPIQASVPSHHHIIAALRLLCSAVVVGLQFDQRRPNMLCDDVQGSSKRRQTQAAGDKESQSVSPF